MRQPGFRRKTSYSGLRDLDGYGFKVAGDCLTLGLGLKREDGVRQVTVHRQHCPGVGYRKVVRVLMTYDEKHGMEAHRVVDVEDGQAEGTRKLAVGLGDFAELAVVAFDGVGGVNQAPDFCGVVEGGG